MEDIFSRWKTTHVSFDVTKEMGSQCIQITAKVTPLIQSHHVSPCWQSIMSTSLSSNNGPTDDLTDVLDRAYHRLHGSASTVLMATAWR